MNDHNEIDVHDEHWWKHGRSRRLCGDIRHTWALKPSHLVKVCVYSNHVKFRLIQPHFKEISTLAPFTSHYVRLVHDIFVVKLEVPWHFKRVPTKILQMETMTFDNETPIMNVVANMDDIKDYVVGTSNILESWNPPIMSRHVSSLTMLNFDAYMHSLKKLQRWPHSLLTMRGRCKMTFVMGLLDVPWHFKRVPKKIL